MIFAKLLQHCRAFGRDGRAVAAVEFALILPFMLSLYVGTLELSQIIVVDRRITIIGSTVADLVAQANGSIKKTDLDSYFAAAQTIIAPFSTTGLTQVVSLISVDKTTGATKVVWSRGYNGGVEKTVGASYPLPATSEMNKLARGSWLVVSNVNYSYTALLALVFRSAVPYTREDFFVPRFGKVINLTD